MIHPLTGQPVAGGPHLWPVRRGGMTGRVGYFGWTRDGGRKEHRGIDWETELGQPVYAAHDGVIRVSGSDR